MCLSRRLFCFLGGGSLTAQTEAADRVASAWKPFTRAGAETKCGLVKAADLGQRKSHRAAQVNDEDEQYGQVITSTLVLA